MIAFLLSHSRTRTAGHGRTAAHTQGLPGICSGQETDGMKLWSALLGLVLFASLLSPACLFAEEYSLDDLYQIALKRAEQIKLSEEDLTISALEKNRALSVLIPKLTATNDYLKFSEDKYNSGILVQPNSADQWSIRLDQQFSLSFREFTALSIAGKNIEKSREDLVSVQEGYLIQVAQAYFNVLKAMKGLDIADTNLDRLLKYRDAAEKRLKVGEVTKTVLLRAESELSGARSDKVKAENALALTKVVLARLVGIEKGYTIKDSQRQDAEIASLPELEDTAFSERSDLKSLEFQKKIAEQEVSYSTGAFFPNLAISGVYQRSDQDPESPTLNRESIYGALSLNFPLFEGGLRRAELLEAKARQRQANLLYEDQKKTVALEVQSAYLDLITQKGTLKYLEDQLAFAQDNMRAVSRQFVYGLASSLDVIDANTLLVTSQRQLADAVYQYQLSVLSVKKATGVFLKEIRQVGI
jgi:outer membrane protein